MAFTKYNTFMYKSRTKKTGKYNAHKCEYDGKTFDSALERDRYIVLKRAEKDGRIHNLRLQVVYELLPQVWKVETKQLKTKTKLVKRELFKPCTYKADFVYSCKGYVIVEDTKGMVTPEYAIKEKLLFDKHRVFIHRIKRAGEEIGKLPPTIYEQI